MFLCILHFSVAYSCLSYSFIFQFFYFTSSFPHLHVSLFSVLSILLLLHLFHLVHYTLHLLIYTSTYILIRFLLIILVCSSHSFIISHMYYLLPHLYLHSSYFPTFSFLIPWILEALKIAFIFCLRTIYSWVQCRITFSFTSRQTRKFPTNGCLPLFILPTCSFVFR